MGPARSDLAQAAAEPQALRSRRGWARARRPGHGPGAALPVTQTGIQNFIAGPRPPSPVVEMGNLSLLLNSFLDASQLICSHKFEASVIVGFRIFRLKLEQILRSKQSFKLRAGIHWPGRRGRCRT